MGRKNPELWERAKRQAVSKMGGRHSARAMQLAGSIYRKLGGKYTGSLTKAQKSMKKWSKEDWGTRSGKPSVLGKKATGERYLPKKERAKLTKKQYAATTRKKRADEKKGIQFSRQPKKIRKKLGRKT